MHTTNNTPSPEQDYGLLPDTPPSDRSFRVAPPDWYHKDTKETNNVPKNGHHQVQTHEMKEKVHDEMPQVNDIVMETVSASSTSTSFVPPPPPSSNPKKESQPDAVSVQVKKNPLTSPMADFVDNQFGTVRHGMAPQKVIAEVAPLPSSAHTKNNVKPIEPPAADQFCYTESYTAVTKSTVPTIPSSSTHPTTVTRTTYNSFQPDNTIQFDMWQQLQIFQDHLPSPSPHDDTTVDNDGSTSIPNHHSHRPPRVNGSTMPYPPPVTTAPSTTHPVIEQTNDTPTTTMTTMNIPNIHDSVVTGELNKEIKTKKDTPVSVMEETVMPNGRTVVHEEVEQPKEIDTSIKEDDTRTMVALPTTENSDTTVASLVTAMDSMDQMDHDFSHSQAESFLDTSENVDTLTLHQVNESSEQRDEVALLTSTEVVDNDSAKVPDTEDDDRLEKREKIMDALALGGLATVGLVGVSSIIGIEAGTLLDIALVGMAANAIANVGNSVHRITEDQDSILPMEEPVGTLEPRYTAYEPDNSKKD
jgi:hypothetical protein